MFKLDTTGKKWNLVVNPSIVIIFLFLVQYASYGRLSIIIMFLSINYTSYRLKFHIYNK